MKKEFKPGMYCKFPNEEIPRILDILRANGHIIYSDRQPTTYWGYVIFQPNHKQFMAHDDIDSVRAHCLKDENELSRHDFMVKALRLEEGMGICYEDSTSKQRRHIYDEMRYLGLNVYGDRTGSGFDSVNSYYFDGSHWLSTDEDNNYIPYHDWCQRLCVEPIGTKSFQDEYVEMEFGKPEERYPMCEDQPAQIDCRITDCDYHKCGSCNNVSPAITLNENGTFVCWSKSLKKPTAEPVFDPSKPFEVSNGHGWGQATIGGKTGAFTHYVGKSKGGLHVIQTPAGFVEYLDIRNTEEFNASMLKVGEWMEVTEVGPYEKRPPRER